MSRAVAATFTVLLLGSACGRATEPSPSPDRNRAVDATARPLTVLMDYDPANFPKQSHHSATLLPSGKVFVAMGYDNQEQPGLSFDLRSGTFSPVGTISLAKSWPWRQTGSLLPTGDTAVTGGIGGATAFETSTAVFSLRASNAQWEPEAFLGFARENHTSTVLRDGTVIVAGGHSTVAGPWRSVERRDPRTGAWLRTFDLSTTRDSGTATLLRSGSTEYVLFTGGGSSTSEVCEAAPGGLCRVLPFPGWWFWDPTATQLADGRVLLVGASRDPSTPGSADVAVAALFTPGALGTDTPGSWSAVASPPSARHGHSATLLASGKVLVSGGADALGTEFSDSALYDPATDIWSTLPGSSAWLDAATLLPTGQVLFTGSKPQVFDPGGESFTPGAGLSAPRAFSSTTVLASGQVLLVGGQDSTGAARSSAVLYQPGTGEVGQVTLQAARREHTATLLPGGEVLIAGGYGVGGAPLASAETLAAGASTTTLVPQNLPAARAGHRAVLLPGGRVLVTGGYSASGGLPLDAAALYTPGSRSWTAAGSIVEGRAQHTATAFSYKIDTKECLDCALVVGGRGGPASPALSAPMRFDGSTGAWSAASSVGLIPRRDHAAVLLPSGTILVIGGSSGAGAALGSVQEYEPRLDRWTERASLGTARTRHQAVVLSSGKVLVTGGVDRDTGGAAVQAAELYDPYTNRWTPVGSTSPHEAGRSVLLPDRRVAVLGGLGAGATDVDLFDSGLSPLPSLRPTLAALPAEAVAGETLRLAGTGLMGRAEGGSGTFQSSNTNFPLISLQHQESGLIDFASTSDWSPTATNATLPAGLPLGRYWVRAFANGAPSEAQVLELVATGPTIAPVATTMPPGKAVKLVSPGGQDWRLRSSGSGGAVDLAGTYTAGRAGNTIDVVEVKNGNGRAGTLLIRVGAGVSVSPPLTGADPGAKVTFKVRGGTGGGYTWSISSRGSGTDAAISSTGAYTAGALQGTDLIEARDPLGNVGTATVEVGRAIVVTAEVKRQGLSQGPAARVVPGVPVRIEPGDAIDFKATGGSGHGYLWSPIVDHDFVNWSSIDATTGRYQNGGFGWLTDTVRVQDSDGRLAEVGIKVGPPFLISPLHATVPALAAITFTPNQATSGWHVQGCEPNTGATVRLCCTPPEPCAEVVELSSAAGRYQAGPTTNYVDEVWSRLGRHAFVTVVAPPADGAPQVLPLQATVWPALGFGGDTYPGGTVQFEVPGATVQGWSVGTHGPQGAFVAGSPIGSAISTGGLYVAGANPGISVVTEYIHANTATGATDARVDVLGRLAYASPESGGVTGAGGTYHVPVSAQVLLRPLGGLLGGADGAVGDALATFQLEEGGSVDGFIDAPAPGAATWAYNSGTIPGREDHLILSDGVFPPERITMRITNATPLQIEPAEGQGTARQVAAAPTERIAFWSTGGSPFSASWTLDGQAGSGTAAAIERETGVYHAGANEAGASEAIDRIKATDDQGNVATVTVKVGPPLRLGVSGAGLPGDVIQPKQTRTFSVSGGKAPYRWSLQPNRSEAQLLPLPSSSDVQYVAGPSTEVDDTLLVEDSVGVTRQVLIPVRSPLPKAGGCSTGGGGLLALLWLGGYLVVRRRPNRAAPGGRHSTPPSPPGP